MTSDVRGRRRWSGVAEAYAQSFALLCAGTIDDVLSAARATDGTHLLDVGAGTGLLADRAASYGAVVTAVEPDPDMLAIAGTRLGNRVTLLPGGLPELPVDDGTKDAAVSNFVVNHVGDPGAAARELARVVRPGGLVVVTTWTAEPSALNRLWAGVVGGSGAVPPEPDVLPRELDFERSLDGVARLLGNSGLVDVEARPVSWDWRVDPDVLWSALEAGIAGIGRVWTAQTPAVRQRMREEYDVLRQELMDGDQLVLPSTAALAVGRVAVGRVAVGRAPGVRPR